MPKRPPEEAFLPLKPVVFEILLSLATNPRHGYGVLQRVRERSGGRIRLETGPLYRHLKRLLDDGLVVEAEGDEDGDERRRYYALTGLGRAVVHAEGRRLAALVERVRSLGPHAP